MGLEGRDGDAHSSFSSSAFLAANSSSLMIDSRSDARSRNLLAAEGVGAGTAEGICPLGCFASATSWRSFARYGSHEWIDRFGAGMQLGRTNGLFARRRGSGRSHPPPSRPNRQQTPRPLPIQRHRGGFSALAVTVSKQKIVNYALRSVRKIIARRPHCLVNWLTWQ
jgi:hypothetical protein